MRWEVGKVVRLFNMKRKLAWKNDTDMLTEQSSQMERVPTVIKILTAPFLQGCELGHDTSN